MKKRVNFWDILAWVVLAGIVVWLILKMLGVINTPTLLEYAPYFGVAYLLGWNVHKLEGISKKVNNFEKFKDDTIKEINNIKTTCIIKHK